jgi:hypothetical protein
MLAEAPPRQLDEWLAYNRIEPFGALRGDMQAGMICNHIIGAAGGDFRPVHEYILKFGRDPEDQMDPDEIEHQLMLFAQAHNARLAEQAGGAMNVDVQGIQREIAAARTVARDAAP